MPKEYKCSQCEITDPTKFYSYRTSKCKKCMRDVSSKSRNPNIVKFAECKQCGEIKSKETFFISSVTGLLSDRCKICKPGVRNNLGFEVEAPGTPPPSPPSQPPQYDHERLIKCHVEIIEEKDQNGNLIYTNEGETYERTEWDKYVKAAHSNLNQEQIKNYIISLSKLLI